MAQILESAREHVREKTRLSGWVLPKQETSYAPDGTWTNIDLDVTPPERRTWTAISMLGYWVSDILSAQSWQIGASVLAIGLTYREAIWCVLVGSVVMSFAIAFNGAPGAYLRVPFPVWIRAAFGYTGGKFPVACRIVTALFWHAIQTYTGSIALTVMLSAIWPSYLKIPNHLPKSAGITSQGLLSHFLFWCIQLPFLLVQPHKLKWFFVFKAVVTITAAVGTTIAVCVQAGGSGDIWDQKPVVSGWTRSWLIVSTLTAQTGSWSTVGTNISDFTRYLKKPRNTFFQCIFFPVICFSIAILGIISASASKVLYGEYVWDPLSVISPLASKWKSPGGRAAAFYCGLAWMVAQIGVNVSANVISASNDLASFFPKYINIRRAAVLCTITGGWIMVPWKIITSAQSLLNFMASLGIFLAPIIAISIADYWLLKQRRVEVPSLYDPRGRYAYHAGWNWRALLAMLVSIGPTLPSLVKNVKPSADIGGASYIADPVWYYGFLGAFLVYLAVNILWTPAEALMSEAEFAAARYAEAIFLQVRDKQSQEF
ncbi:putative permease [Pseudocercospora fuligena]|uniref:Putative permease n=1 Tax=Pseudocercospora fuligena TaxID=685502 RepID=A0A8H6RJ61_9PEZI|nr:putative permease [Pseudocercospora fuligena]